MMNTKALAKELIRQSIELEVRIVKEIMDVSTMNKSEVTETGHRFEITGTVSVDWVTGGEWDART